MVRIKWSSLKLAVAPQPKEEPACRCKSPKHHALILPEIVTPVIFAPFARCTLITQDFSCWSCASRGSCNVLGVRTCSSDPSTLATSSRIWMLLALVLGPHKFQACAQAEEPKHLNIQKAMHVSSLHFCILLKHLSYLWLVGNRGI